MRMIYTRDRSDRDNRFSSDHIFFRADDLYDLYDLARVAGWEPYDLHDLGHVSLVGSALYISRASYHSGSLGSTADYICVHDLSVDDLSVDALSDK